MMEREVRPPAVGSQDLAGWLSYLETILGAEFSMRPGLERSASVWRRLNPEGRRLASQIVVVAGTNGKGSTAAAIGWLGQASHLRVGIYGSPHVLRFNERCRINGEEVTDAAFCRAFECVEAARKGDGEQAAVPLSYYEFTTLAVFELLRAERLDLVVLEVGLGGRLDTVNLIDADLAVITRIGLDHQAVLGDTLEQIGGEKAGVLRDKGLCVLGAPNMPSSVLSQVQALDCQVRIYGQHFDEQRYGLTNASRGQHGARLPAANLAAACAAFELLGHALPSDHIERLNQLTLPGRLQILQVDPMICVDAAHNEQAAVFLADWLRAQVGIEPQSEVRAVFSCYADKSIEALIQPMLALVNEWHLFPLEGARAATLPRLEQAASNALAAARVDQTDAPVPEVRVHTSLSAALEAARDGLAAGDCIVAFGSFMVVEAMLLKWENMNNNSTAT